MNIKASAQLCFIVALLAAAVFAVWPVRYRVHYSGSGTNTSGTVAMSVSYSSTVDGPRMWRWLDSISHEVSDQ